MSRGRGRPRMERQIRITPIRRDEIDVPRLARALLALAQADDKAQPSPEVGKREEEGSNGPS